jgi:putative tryptophan/tyrosine transport system substrate-binding protein
MVTIGLLHSGSKESFTRQVGALVTGLAVKGYQRGTDYDILEKWALDKADILNGNARDLVRAENVKLIVAAGGPQPAMAAMSWTDSEQSTIPERDRKPIVFTTVANPAGNGLVGKNATGMAGKTSELDDDRLRLLAELLKDSPGKKKVHAFFKKNRPGLQVHKTYLNGVATSELEMDPLDVTEADDDDDIDNSFSAARFANTHAILVTADSFFNNRRKKMVDKAIQVKRPAIYQWREFVELGGLMSYGPSLNEAYVFAGVYAARILFDKKEKPADIPLSEPTSRELVINLKTADAIKFTVPRSLRDRAELIE